MVSVSVKGISKNSKSRLATEINAQFTDVNEQFSEGA